jgi:hypothetical protein
MAILKAGILTVAIVVGSAFINAGIGRGGWLLGTLPLSPFIFGFLFLIFRLWGEPTTVTTEIRLRHTGIGDEVIAYEGYGWTSLFFCGFPALLRGDIALGLSVLFAWIVIGISAYAVGVPTWLSTTIVGGIWGFFYNEIHRERLLRAGYEPIAVT